MTRSGAQSLRQLSFLLCSVFISTILRPRNSIILFSLTAAADVAWQQTCCLHKEMNMLAIVQEMVKLMDVCGVMH